MVTLCLSNCLVIIFILYLHLQVWSLPQRRKNYFVITSTLRWNIYLAKRLRFIYLCCHREKIAGSQRQEVTMTLGVLLALLLLCLGSWSWCWYWRWRWRTVLDVLIDNPGWDITGIGNHRDLKYKPGDPQRDDKYNSLSSVRVSRLIGSLNGISGENSKLISATDSSLYLFNFILLFIFSLASCGTGTEPPVLKQGDTWVMRDDDYYCGCSRVTLYFIIYLHLVFGWLRLHSTFYLHQNIFPAE